MQVLHRHRRCVTEEEKKGGNLYVQGAVGFAEEKETTGKVKEILYSCATLLDGAGIKDLPNRPEGRPVKVERGVRRGSDSGGCGNIVSCWIRDGP